MKTTIEIQDELLARARETARRRKTTLRALVEAGLRSVLKDAARKKPFVLRDASVGGNGLQPGVRLEDWDQIRDMIYEGRGS